MRDVQKSYADYHERNDPINVYPTEWVVRTLLGTYPGVALDRSTYAGAAILDAGFGDGRNWPLLRDLGFDIHGLEISESILTLGEKRAQRLGVRVNLMLGTNASVPVEDATFDYLLACHSCYYVDAGTTFSDTVAEYTRILKPGGIVIASLPEAGASIFDDCLELHDGHVEIRNDPWGLRNGYIFRRFETEGEVEAAFSPSFEHFAIGLCRDNYFGVRINVFLLVCHKPVAANAGSGRGVRASEAVARRA